VNNRPRRSTDAQPQLNSITFHSGRRSPNVTKSIACGAAGELLAYENRQLAGPIGMSVLSGTELCGPQGNLFVIFYS
jgi:hypothetical protein